MAHSRGQASEWNWILDGDLEIGGTLIFARGKAPEDVIRTFGMDPAAARLLPAGQAGKVLRLPVLDDRLHVIHPWIRTGQTGQWAFAIDEGAAGYGGYEEDAARALSAGTEVAWFYWTQTVDYFHYLVDGVVVTAFGPLLTVQRGPQAPEAGIEPA